MIQAKGINFGYSKKKYVLKNVDFEIHEGEIVVVIGKNGCGKTTLAGVMAGLLEDKKNQIILDGDEMRKMKSMDLRRKIGIVFQNPNLQAVFPNVREDIKFTLNNLELSNIDKRIKNALKMAGMEKYIDANAFELSLGQKQKIAIANALAIEPRYVIFDESTCMLDTKSREDVYRIVKKLKGEGRGVMFVTNNIDEILMGDRIVILEDGKIYANISMSEEKQVLETLEELGFGLSFYFRMLKEGLVTGKVRRCAREIWNEK